MKRRVLGLMGAFLLLPAVAFAVPVAITWEWTLDDPDVTTFRYQLDGEDPDGWTVVDASHTSYTAENMDGTKSYTLYLQQSYDGEHFSASATSTSEPLETEEPVPAEPVVEQAPTVAETPVSAEAETAPAPVAEEPAAEASVPSESEPVAVAEPASEPVATPVAPQPAAKAPKNRAPFRFGFGVYGSADKVLDEDSYPVLDFHHSWFPELGGEIKLENILAGKHVGIGLDLRGAWVPTPEGKWKDVFDHLDELNNAMYGSAALELDLNFGKTLLTLGAGGFGAYNLDDWTYGVLGSAGIGYHFTKHLYMGVDGQYRYYLDNTEKAQTLSGSASMSSGAARRRTSVWNSSMICLASSAFSVALPAPVNCRRSRLDSTSKLQSRSTSSACFGAFVRFASTKAAASSVATARRTISRVLSRVLCRPVRSNHSPAGSITRTAS